MCDEFWRNRSGESVRIQLCEFKGRLLVDLRVHVMRDGKLVPTQKGLSLSITRLPELALAVARALKEARRRGLLRSAQ